MTPVEPTYFLLVDDLEENLRAVEALLRRDSLVILKAQSGPEALELLLKHDIALALIDVQMPEMDGFELAELMRGTERTRRVPIIFVTAGNADRQRHFRGYEAGAVDFIRKPIDPHILKSKAEVFFDLFQQRQAVVVQRDEIARLLAETQKYAETLKEVDRRKDDFLAMLAHELRNPLAPVMNAVEILRLSETADSTIGEVREIISRQVRHMARLIDDLLDVARITRSKIELRPEQCDFRDIVRKTTEDYRGTLEAAGLSLTVELPDGTVPLVGDCVRLAQVIGNLLHNASKFTPRGGCVQINLRQSDETAVLSIKDNGSGMDAAVLSSLFEPFVQANQSMDRTKGGLGLGLALVRGLVELHHGSVVAASEGPGLGSDFIVRLPTTSATDDGTTQDKLPATVFPARALQILIIEDNQDTAKSLQQLLMLLGHDVQVAADGRQALKMIRRLLPQVVLSDLGLPGDLDGYSIAKTIRADPTLPPIFLIAISGYGQADDRLRAEVSGFNLHLVKPVERDALEHALQSMPTQSIDAGN
jgi:signal transduction histidine kinase